YVLAQAVGLRNGLDDGRLGFLAQQPVHENLGGMGWGGFFMSSMPPKPVLSGGGESSSRVTLALTPCCCRTSSSPLTLPLPTAYRPRASHSASWRLSAVTASA